MSAPDLPDNLANWPRNPYDLLCVRPGVDARDLRRAYTRLIRAFKPEQHPEQFRRIREAYEHVQGQLEFFRSIQSTRDEEGPDDGPPPSESLPPPRDWAPTNEPDLFDELGRLWESIGRGEEAAAYRTMRGLLEQHPGHADIAVRLYWLLYLFPDLDADRTPCDWLTTALRTTGLTGAPRELYRRAIADDPAEALTERCRRLLDLPVRVGLVADLAEWRWQAACRVGRWEVIAADHESLRDRILREDEETWVRLLMTAVEQLLAVPDDGATSLAERCWQEVGKFTHLHGGLADSLDRLELVYEAARGWHLLRRDHEVRGSLLRLIPLSWSRSFVEVRPLLLSYLAEVAWGPWGEVQVFDLVNRKAPAVLTQLGHLLMLLQETLPDLPALDSRPLLELAKLYLDEAAQHGYGKFRRQLLDWCVQESADPEVVAAAVAGGALADPVSRDGPLRYVCWACRLFWA